MILKKNICIRMIVAIGLTCFGIVLFGCSDQRSPDPLKAAILTPPKNQEIKKGEMVYFKGSASGGASPYSYLWSFGTGIPQSSEKVPGELIFNYEGAYTVTLTVTDSKGETDKISVGVWVESEREF